MNIRVFYCLLKNIYKSLINAKSYQQCEDTLKQSNEKELDVIPKTAKWILLMLFVGGNVRKYNEPVLGKIRLLKEIFLLKEQSKISENMYNFIPYKYGPFAKEFLQDLDFLLSKNYISVGASFGGDSYQLTPIGLQFAEQYYNDLDDSLKRRLLGIKMRFNMMPLNELLEYIYSMYPDYASNSQYFNENKFEGA